MVNIIDNKIVKIIIIGLMMLLMLCMISSFPASSAQTNEESIVSIR